MVDGVKWCPTNGAGEGRGCSTEEEHQGGRAAGMMENTRKSKGFRGDRVDGREHHEDH